ncbi:hypothetical protein [Phyllobacterium sp. K27]
MTEFDAVNNGLKPVKMVSKVIVSEADILSTRQFVQLTAKATRWKDPVPDPAENQCCVIVRIDTATHVFLQFDGLVQFPISVAMGAITVNRAHILPSTNRHGEIMTAAKQFALSITPSKATTKPDASLALINKFITMWRSLDETGEPKSSFEIYRMFAASPEANELLKQVRQQFSPYIHGEFNRFQQMDEYLSSRPDRFATELSLIAGNKLWAIK